MLDGVVIQTVAGEQHADAGLGAVVARAYLVELGDGAARVVGLSQFQISLGQQVEVLRAVGMFLDLFDQFGLIELSPGLGSKIGAVVEILKKVLIRIGSRGRIFGESLEDTQIPLCRFILMEAPLNHGELVVSGSRVAADFDVSTKQSGRFLELLVGDSQVGQLQ